MFLRRPSVIAIVVLTLVVGNKGSASLAADPFSEAKDQAFELGPVLARVSACDGEAAREELFHEFMTAKRKRGLDGSQTATIAALVGGSESHAANGQAMECSADDASRRAALIGDMRKHW